MWISKYTQTLRETEGQTRKRGDQPAFTNSNLERVNVDTIRHTFEMWQETRRISCDTPNLVKRFRLLGPG